MWLPAAIGIGGSLIGGLLGSGAAKKAGKIVSDAGNAAADRVGTAEQLQQGYVSGAAGEGQSRIDAGKNQANDVLTGGLNRQTDNLNPYLQVGQQSAQGLMEASAPGGSLTRQFSAPTAEEAAATPGFQFQLQQGNQALQRAAAAGGSLMSGGTLKAASQYGQGLASTYYQNAYNNALTSFQTNRNNTLGTLMAGLNVGQTATSQFDQSQQHAGSLMSGNITNAAANSAQIGVQAAEFNSGQQLQASKLQGDYTMAGAQGLAAGTAGAGNAWSQALNGISNGGANLASSIMAGKPTIYNPYAYAGVRPPGVPLPGASPSYDGSDYR